MKICPVCHRCFANESLTCSKCNQEFLSESRAGNREIIANYRLDFLHESSATGETYRAFNISLAKDCLINIIEADLFAAEPNLRESFLRETQDLSSIIHQNLARVLERGMLPDGSVYVVTEFVAGQTLRDLLAQNGVTEVSALGIAGQIAEGLHAIHTLGILHRNIRPENIILTKDAGNNLSAKIQNLDFGGIRQKIICSEVSKNISDLKYFSPEQCAGKPIDAQTDVYSLGVVLYEILAGELPFDAPDAEILISKKLKLTAPSVHINNFNIRALLSHTVADALQKPKRLRLKSANVFARRLRYIEQIATHSSTPPPAISYVHNQPSKIEIPEDILADLPTEELPPLESITGDFSFQNEPEKTTLIEWEQPDDIPLLTKNIETESISEPKFYQDSVIDLGEVDITVDYLPKVQEERKRSSFIPAEFFKGSWNLPDRRTIWMGAGIAAVLFLLIGGTFLSRQSQLEEDARRTIVKSAPTPKSVPQPTPAEIAKPEDVTTTDSSSVVETANNSDLPDYQPREVEDKQPVPLAETRSKKEVVKSPVVARNKPPQSKPTLTDSSFNKKGEVVDVKKTTVIIIPSATREKDVFARPRIVGKQSSVRVIP
jgi:eukaryotic-like serine/threonine-protein kinase